MSAFRQIFLGLFTHHVPTKMLALLLALVVFVFVRNSQQASRTIDNLQLTFRLQGDAAQNWVIENPVLENLEVTITGIRTHVDQAVVALGDETKVQIPLDENLLKAIGASLNVSHQSIPIDARVLTRLEIISTDLVKIETIVTPEMLDISRRAEVELAVVAGELRLDSDSTWTAEDGTNSVTAVFSPASVRIAGPEREFQRGDNSLATLEVDVRDINDTLRGSATGEISDRRITGINWNKMKFDADDLAKLEVVKPAGVAIEDLWREIRYSFKVKAGIETKDLADVKIVLQIPPGFDLEEYEVQRVAGLINLQTQVIEKLTIRGPKNVLEDEEFLKKLVAVIDIAGAKDEGKRKNAFIHLALAKRKDATPADLNKLRQLTIPVPEGQTSPPYLQLTPKPLTPPKPE